MRKESRLKSTIVACLPRWNLFTSSLVIGVPYNPSTVCLFFGLIASWYLASATLKPITVHAPHCPPYSSVFARCRPQRCVHPRVKHGTSIVIPAPGPSSQHSKATWTAPFEPPPQSPILNLQVTHQDLHRDMGTNVGVRIRWLGLWH